MQDAGLSVPDDVSVLGFDDVAFAGVHRPALSTVRQPLHRMGVLAANAVLERLNAQESTASAPACIMVEPELIVRCSTAMCGTAER